MELSKNIIYYGSANDLPEQIPLRAGPLKMVFENGDLRNIRLGDIEVVNRIYVAVRDKNWETVRPALSNLEIQKEGDSFQIKFEVENREADIFFTWKGEISGNDAGKIRFSMMGLAQTTFLKNRIGFCVLHSTNCAGSACKVTHSDGRKTESRFPKLIQPHQPFADIRSLEHQATPDLWVKLEFSGDIFEMEDQRNWTDASFKTYGTPLAIPFPVEVKAGDQIEQSVTLTLNGTIEVSTPTRGGGSSLSLTLHDGMAFPIPAIGLADASHEGPLSDREIRLLNTLDLSHLRIDVDFSDRQWMNKMKPGAANAGELELPFEIAIRFEARHTSELGQLGEFLKNEAARLSRLLIINDKDPESLAAKRALLQSTIKSHFPEVFIGAGSDANFTELNRSRPNTDGLDFLFYSINPQVHAFDNGSLIETLPVQADTVVSAGQFSNGLPVSVSPVTLKQRFNPVATQPTAPFVSPKNLPPPVDPRQMSLFAAGWTLGSLFHLTRAGVQSVTYFETTGWRGVMETETGPPQPDLFPSFPGATYPLFHVFAAVAKFKQGTLIPLRMEPSQDLVGFALKQEDKLRILLANLGQEIRSLRIEKLKGNFSAKFLDEKSFPLACGEPETFRGQTGVSLPMENGGFAVQLLPYSVVQIDSVD